VKTRLIRLAAAAAVLLAPAVAQAAEGVSTANVNMRAGPSTQYPAVTVIPAGESVEIHGCLADVPWCDVEFYGGRGWVAGRYVQALYQERRVYVGPEYYRPLGIPTVVFSVGNYWDRYYRNRDFYRERDRWRRNPVYDRPAVVRPDRAPDFDRPGRAPRGFDGGPGPRPDFGRGPDRGADDGRNPDWRRDFDGQPDRRPNVDRGPDRRPDNRPLEFNRREDHSGRGERNRDQDRGRFQRPPGQDDGANQGRRGDHRRQPVCQPGDPSCDPGRQ
jgi:uncharacterized protein YraI